MLERAANERGNTKIVCLEDLVPREHILRKIERAVDFNEIYPMVEQYYCEDNGRPAVDPVVLVKIVLIQRLFGIRSLMLSLMQLAVSRTRQWHQAMTRYFFLDYGVK